QLGRWSPPFAWMAMIYFLSTDHLSFPGFRRTWTGFLVAKATHLVEYAVLTLLWYRAIVRRLTLWSPAAALQACIAASTYAVLDEIHQSFTSERVGSPRDVILDSFGALLTILVVWSTHRRRVNREALLASEPAAPSGNEKGSG